MLNKLLLLLVVLVLQGCSGVSAKGYILKVKDVTAKPGENVAVNLEIINETPIVAFQLDIPLPLGFQYVPNSITLNSDRQNGHVVQANVLSNSNILRIISFSLSNADFSGSNGIIATFTLQTPNVAGNFPLVVEKSIVADRSAQNLITSTENGTVKLIEK
jgi:hypothetical protein